MHTRIILLSMWEPTCAALQVAATQTQRECSCDFFYRITRDDLYPCIHRITAKTTKNAQSRSESDPIPDKQLCGNEEMAISEALYCQQQISQEASGLSLFGGCAWCLLLNM